MTDNTHTVNIADYRNTDIEIHRENLLGLINNYEDDIYLYNDARDPQYAEWLDIINQLRLSDHAVEREFYDGYLRSRYETQLIKRYAGVCAVYDFATGRPANEQS